MKSIQFVVPCVVVLGFAMNLAALPQDSKAKKVSMADARTTALASSNGKVKSEELEKEHGKQIYSFDIQMPDGLHEVNVDAATGKLIDDKVESAADEAKEAAQDKKEAAVKAKKAKKAAAAKPDLK
jgi:Skp family chaperone for outer membrane proteins